MQRRPLLLNSVMLRQNPHNVLEWQKRVTLYEGKPKMVRNIITCGVKYLFILTVQNKILQN